jgi:hypothetical protein
MFISRIAAMRRRYSYTLILLSVGLGLTSLLHAQAPVPSSASVRGAEAVQQQLPVRRVVLYKSGVGYFEHVGRVRGNQQMTIDFSSSQLDDVLKSLTALDLDGGRVTNVGYNSEAGLDRRLAGLRLPIGQNASRAQFLSALRGARLEVRSGAGRFSGRLLTVEPIERRVDGVVSRVDSLSLVSDGGDVRTIPLDAGVSVRILDADLSQEVARYLALVGSIRDQDVRRLTISTAGTGDRDLFVSYVSEVPVWKATYRIVLPGAGETRRPLLQGWAIVDNTIGQDWESVQMSLVAGAPQSFVHQISRPYYVQRPIVPLPSSALFAPQTHQSALTTAGPGAITGVVTDLSGGIIPGASVRVTRGGTPAGQAVSDTQGRYRVGGLTAGSYSVTVTLQGFKTVVHPTVNVSGGMETIANARLEVGQISEEVSVTASSSTVSGLPRFSTSLTVDGVSTGVETRANTVASRVTSARAGVQSQASGDSLGDLFEYKLREPITIRKNQSALVPIASGDIEAEKVSLWTANGTETRPLRAIWLRNTTPLTLDAGSFSIVEAQAFVGEGMMESLKAGERRLLSYAMDLGLVVDATSDEPSPRFVRVRVNRGLVTHEVEERETFTYSVRNEDREARTLVIEHPVRDGWKIGGAVAPVETTPAWHRYRVQVPAKTAVTLTVEETQPLETSYSVSDITDDRVKLFVSERVISPATETGLREVIRRKAEIARLASEAGGKDREIAAIAADQQRLRQNMQALKGTREERELLQRYVRQLADQENRLDAVRAEQARLAGSLRRAQADLAEFIETLSTSDGK